MVSWYELVKNYDDPKNGDLKSKDHGTFSQKIAVILLIYLAFGKDYPTGIAKYFIELSNKGKLGKYYPGALMYSAKISSVLKRMEKDNLVILSERVSVGAGIRLYYELNPKIIQSPVKDSNSLRPGGSIFEIPLTMVEQLLAWKDWKYEGSKAVCEKDEFFKVVVYPDDIDYFFFMEFIRAKAFHQEVEIQNGDYNHRTSLLENLLMDYYHLLEEFCSPDIRYV
jgi:hypothetical protein